jgi:hypothetical protein
MRYEYLVQTQGASSLDSLETLGAKLQRALNVGDVDAYIELGWELWQVSVLNDASGNNGLILIYRRPK